MANKTFINAKELTKAIEKQVNGTFKAQEILNEKFMRANTKFHSLDDFFDTGGWNVDSISDIPDIELDEHTRNNSKFFTFNDMQHQAAIEFTKKRLKL